MVRHVRRLTAGLFAAAVIAGCSESTPETSSATATPTRAPTTGLVIREFNVPDGSHPHDVAPARDGTVWYTAQATGELGRLDPSDGSTKHIDLGPRSAPHGVIVGPDGAPWITDAGMNAIIRVDPRSEAVRSFPLPAAFANAALNTAAFDTDGVLWFTGNNGSYGKVEVDTAKVQAFRAPGGAGPYGITATPNGDVYYASLAGSHIARIDTPSGEATRIDPPTQGQGARRAWSDSRGRVWVTEYNAGKLALFDPASDRWREWELPGDNPRPYAVFVDDTDIVWVSDFGANAIVRFDPKTERFTSVALPSSPGNVRQLLGRPGEVWGAESAADALILIETR